MAVSGFLRTEDLSPAPVDKHVCHLAMALASACHERYSTGLLEIEAVRDRSVMMCGLDMTRPERGADGFRGRTGWAGP